MTTTARYTVDNRWRREWAPPESKAAYGARWISRGGGGGGFGGATGDIVGDVLHDRQGFAYDNHVSRDHLMRGLQDLHLHNPCPFWYDSEPADVTDRAMMEVKCGRDEWGYWASGISRSWSLEFHMECRDGYIYVEAWLLP
jgi:hypothetical protein